jgi:hypothetical protein
MQVTGKCHCGSVRYRAKVDPEKVSICHCVDCQILTGCAYRVSVQVALADFELLKGEIKQYIKTADSGSKRVQAFCPECGTPLYAEALDNPTARSLRVGSVDQRASLRPRRQIWCRSALPWAEDLSKVAPFFAEEGRW